MARCSSSSRSAEHGRGGQGRRSVGAGEGAHRRVPPLRRTRCWARRWPWSPRRSATAQDLVGRLGKRRREPLLERLEAAGILPAPGRPRPGADPAPSVADRRRQPRGRRTTGASATHCVRGVAPEERTRGPDRRPLRHGPRAQGRRPRGTAASSGQGPREGDRRRRLGRQGGEGRHHRCPGRHVRCGDRRHGRARQRPQAETVRPAKAAIAS